DVALGNPVLVAVRGTSESSLVHVGRGAVVQTAGVDGRAAGKERVGVGGPAVVGEGPELGVDVADVAEGVEVTRPVAVEVAAVGVGSTDIPAGSTWILGDDCPAEIQLADVEERRAV